ncbi:MAG: hypothetical protein M0P01_10430 [Treponema sp.]|nr:hypothetical protein [Treponema sp.]
MPLKVTTKKNNLSTSCGKTPFLFISKEEGKISLQKLLDEAADANTTVTRADLAASIQILTETTEHLLCDGYRVEFPFVDLYMKAEGAAKDLTVPFTPKRIKSGHTFSLHALVQKKEEKKLRQEVRWMRVMHNIYGHSPVISKLTYFDDDSTIAVAGRHLDFDPSISRNGLCLKLKGDTREIAPERYIFKKSTEIIAKFPPLEAGDYYAETTNNNHSCCYPFSI